MAKYVVLAFDNDEEADSFSSTIINAGPAPEGSHQSLNVVGVFKRPTLFCECTTKDDKSVRGAKWGWWLHKACGKPKRGMTHHPWNLLHPGAKLTDNLYIGVREGGNNTPPS
jgi:hypothetical protein